MDKQTSFFGTMPFNPLVVLVTWLCIGVPQKIEEKRIYNPFRTKIHHGLIWSQNLTCLVLLETLWNTTHFEQKFTTGLYGVKI
jgi:hypothetical protein